MTNLFADLAPIYIGLAVAITVLAGFVKGAVGFAMPTVMMSGLASFMAPELALAALILPTVVTNVWQALRGGLRAAWHAAQRFRVFIGIVLVFILGSAQLVRILPSWSLYLILGVPVTIFAIVQLAGWRLHLTPKQRPRAEVIFGALAGFMGGITGVWGPTTVAYLTAIDLPKTEHIRVQGMVYGPGAVVLLGAHLQSGVLNAGTLPFSAVMVAPALIGMALGMMVQTRLDQDRFRRATLLVLVVAGLNLIRRGIMG